MNKKDELSYYLSITKGNLVLSEDLKEFGTMFVYDNIIYEIFENSEFNQHCNLEVDTYIQELNEEIQYLFKINGIDSDFVKTSINKAKLLDSFITKYEEYTGIETIYRLNNVILIHGNLINDNNNKNDTQQ